MAALIFGSSSECTRLLATKLLAGFAGPIFTFGTGSKEHVDYAAFTTTYIQTNYDSHSLDAIVEKTILASGVQLCIIGHSTGGEVLDVWARHVSGDGLVHYPVDMIEKTFNIDFLSTYVIMNALYRHTHPTGLKVVLFSSYAADHQVHLYSLTKRFIEDIALTRRHRTDISHQVLKFVNVESKMTTGSSDYATLMDSIVPAKPRCLHPMWIAASDWQEYMVRNIASNNDYLNLLSYPPKLFDPEVTLMDAMLMRRSQSFDDKFGMIISMSLKLMGFDVVVMKKTIDENVGGICPFPHKSKFGVRGISLGVITLLAMAYAALAHSRNRGRRV